MKLEIRITAIAASLALLVTVCIPTSQASAQSWETVGTVAAVGKNALDLVNCNYRIMVSPSTTPLATGKIYLYPSAITTQSSNNASYHSLIVPVTAPIPSLLSQVEYKVLTTAAITDYQARLNANLALQSSFVFHFGPAPLPGSRASFRFNTSLDGKNTQAYGLVATQVSLEQSCTRTKIGEPLPSTGGPTFD